MLSRVAITAARNNAVPSFRASLVPARSFANYSWNRVSSSKPWDKPLRDTVPKPKTTAQANVAFSLEKLPQNIAGFAAIVGCMVFMSPMGVVTGYNMYQGASGNKNEKDADGNVITQFDRKPTNVCKEIEGSAAGNSAGRKFNPRAMHPYMNGLTVGHENQFNRKNSNNFNKA